MITNKFVIEWDNQWVGLDSNSGGYPFKTDNPNQVKWWNKKTEAQKYIDTMQRIDSMQRYQNMHIHEIQFRIVGD